MPIPHGSFIDVLTDVDEPSSFDPRFQSCGNFVELRCAESVSNGSGDEEDVLPGHGCSVIGDGFIVTVEPGTKFGELNPTCSCCDKDTKHFIDGGCPVCNPTGNKPTSNNIETGIGILKPEIDVIDLSSVLSNCDGQVGKDITSKDKFGGTGRPGSSRRKVGDKSTPRRCALGRACATSLAQIPLPQPTSRILGAG
jgi:hypothetical protein